MKTIKQILETTYLPKGGDEKKFWDKHTRKLLDHPVAEPTQFKASTKKSTTNTANRDEASSESVYEAAFNDTSVHTKRADKEPVISRSIDPKTRKGINVVKKAATGEIKIGEEVELEEGTVGHGKYTITTGPKMSGMGEGGPAHVVAKRAKMAKLGVPHHDDPGEYGHTVRVTVKNNETGDTTHHHVYQSDTDRGSKEALVSTRSVGSVRAKQKEHENVLHNYLSGKKVSSLKEDLDEAVNEKQIKKDLDSGMSHDVVIGKHANKKLTNTDEIRKVIQQHAWNKRMKKEEVDLDEKVKNPYAIGMAAAMKQAGDTPPLKKSTIVKGHEIAKSIKKEAMDPVGKADADIDNDGDVDKSDKYLHNRRKAISKALKTEGAKESSEANHKKYIAGAKKTKEEFKEEAEQIDELSKKTLGSYVAKASSAAASDAAKYGQQGSSEKGLSHFRKAYSRLQNIKTAAGKLAKEEVEQIDELSPDTLHAYIKKAVPDVVGRTMSAVASNQSAETKKHASKLGKRISGITSASGRLADKANADQYEEVQQMDEISKKTLGSYVKKASTDQYLKGQAVQYHTNRANTAQGADAAFTKTTRKKHNDAAGEALRKASNRDTGIGRAINRLTKEEVEQIDEISKKTLGSYINKASMRVADKANHAGEIEGRGDSNITPAARSTLTKLNRKTANSLTGISRATSRLTKESVDLDEAFKAGQMKLKDGSSVTVSKDCAESLNSLFSQLNPANKTKMEERLMSSPKGYNEILSFAENING